MSAALTDQEAREYVERRLAFLTAPTVDISPRCWKCGRLLGEKFGRPWSIRCTKCKTRNQRDTENTSQLPR